MSDEKEDTIMDIANDIRERADNATRHGEEAMTHNEAVAMLLRTVADRIDAAIKRERQRTGNAAAMREALENSNGLLEELAEIGEWGESAREQIAENNAALSEPPRNCDVGTPYEQANRMRQFCAKQKRNGIINCGYCPIKHEYQRDCTLSWAQMPYEANEGDAK